MIRHLLNDARSRYALEATERHIEKWIADQELSRIRDAAFDAVLSSTSSLASAPALAVAYAASYIDNPEPDDLSVGAVLDQLRDSGVYSASLAHLLRDIIGNPFRPVTADPTWLTSTVTALAKQMYESRDFTAMPILADALQDAGCDHADILAHCRGDGPHVRGCWVVDLVLSRT
jgi:hypothetical protein